MSLGRYALVVVAVVGGSLGALWPAWLRGLPPAVRWATVLGGALAAANTLVAYSLVLWSSGRSTKVFLRAILGGMVGRMAVMLAAVVAAVLWLDLPRTPLTVSLLAYFVFFLGLELAIVHRRPAVAP